MRAFWMEPSEVECSVAELTAEGILSESCDVRQIGEYAARLKADRQLAHEEQVQLSAMTPKLEAVIAKEGDEHTHVADEIRFFTSGDGVYDVRARDERWIRIWIAAGDVLVIPAKRYHRFLLGQHASIQYVTLFADRSVLLPLFRQSADETRAV